MADRYMYLPSIGLFIVLVWGLAEWARFQPRWLKPVQLAGALALAGCLVLTSIQIHYWRDTITLFTHTIEKTGDNGVAYYCLGIGYQKAGDKPTALGLYTKSVAVEPGYFPAQFSLGKLLLEYGKLADGRQHLDLAEAMAGRNPQLQYNFWHGADGCRRPRRGDASFGRRSALGAGKPGFSRGAGVCAANGDQPRRGVGGI